MIKGAVLYKGVYLAPGSRAMQLYLEKKFKELEKLLRECDHAEQKRSSNG